VNILVDELPTKVLVGGIECKIETDFRACLRIILAFEDDELTDYEKQMILLANLYRKLPADVEGAVRMGLKFLDGGVEPSEEAELKERMYAFNKDAGLIFAAFKQTHGIDLDTDKIHWWKFIALFMDLGSDTAFCNLIGLRKRMSDGTATKEERRLADELGDDVVKIPQKDLRTPEEKAREDEFMRLVKGGGR